MADKLIKRGNINALALTGNSGNYNYVNLGGTYVDIDNFKLNPMDSTNVIVNNSYLYNKFGIIKGSAINNYNSNLCINTNADSRKYFHALTYNAGSVYFYFAFPKTIWTQIYNSLKTTYRSTAALVFEPYAYVYEYGDYGVNGNNWNTVNFEQQGSSSYFVNNFFAGLGYPTESDGYTYGPTRYSFTASNLFTYNNKSTIEQSTWPSSSTSLYYWLGSLGTNMVYGKAYKVGVKIHFFANINYPNSTEIMFKAAGSSNDLKLESSPIYYIQRNNEATRQLLYANYLYPTYLATPSSKTKIGTLTIPTDYATSVTTINLYSSYDGSGGSQFYNDFNTSYTYQHIKFNNTFSLT